MKVKTLVGNEFDNACKELSNMIKKDYCPDLIIGVLTGGGFIGRQVYDYLKKQSSIEYTEIKIQRSGTQKKSRSVVKKLMKMLPYFILDRLRIIESDILEYKAKKNNPKREGSISLNEDVVSLLRDGNKNVLLVDDAIDTGATLKLLKDYLITNYPKIDVRVAVITVTMREPMIKADYCIYNNRTLVRFPWSNDVKL